MTVSGETAPKAGVSYNGRVLKKIHLKNFKLHEDTSIDASRITVFIGPNNSGKSSIFQALLVLRRAMRGRGSTLVGSSSQRQDTSPEQPYLLPSERTVDVGEFQDIVRRNSNELEIGLEGELPQQTSSLELLKRVGAVALGFRVSVRGDLLRSHEGWLSCGFGKARWSYPLPQPATANSLVITLADRYPYHPDRDRPVPIVPRRAPGPT